MKRNETLAAEYSPDKERSMKIAVTLFFVVFSALPLMLDPAEFASVSENDAKASAAQMSYSNFFVNQDEKAQWKAYLPAYKQIYDSLPTMDQELLFKTQEELAADWVRMEAVGLTDAEIGFSLDDLNYRIDARLQGYTPTSSR